MRLTASFQENDGINCYDRAILAVAEIEMRRLGLDELAAKYQSKILKSFVHRALVACYAPPQMARASLQGLCLPCSPRWGDNSLTLSLPHHHGC